MKKKQDKKTGTKKWIEEKIGFLYTRLGKEMDKRRHPFLPKNNFYKNWNYSDDGLMIMGEKIMSYLGEPVGNMKIMFIENLGDTPGIFTITEDGTEIIAVNNKHTKNQYIVGAILAHEIMHLYLMSRKKIVLQDTQENELLTDLGTIYLGLGILTINGMEYKSNWFLTLIGLIGGALIINTKKLSFGYFKPEQYGKHLKRYFKNNNTQLKIVALYVHPKSWYFIRGLPLKAKLNNKSIFLMQARIKIILNSIGISIMLIIVVLFIHSAVNPEESNNYNQNQSNFNAKLMILSNELDNMDTKITLQEKQLEELKNKLRLYESKNNIEKYNQLVPTYNNLLTKHKIDIEEYNKKINTYNQSIQN